MNPALLAQWQRLIFPPAPLPVRAGEQAKTGNRYPDVKGCPDWAAHMAGRRTYAINPCYPGPDGGDLCRWAVLDIDEGADSLGKARALLAVWVKNETVYSLSNAYELINVAEKFKDQPLPKFGRSVLYALAAPSTPDAINWIINNQLGRRNLHPDQASYLRGKRYNGEKRQGSRTDLETSDQNDPKLQTADRLWKLAARNKLRRNSDCCCSLEQVEPRSHPPSPRPRPGFFVHTAMTKTNEPWHTDLRTLAHRPTNLGTI